MRVLVVDDSPPVRARLIERLRDAGMEVVGEAGTARDAVAVAGAVLPDAVVLDLQLPDRNGMEILPALGAAGAIVAVITNETHPEYRRRCLALGAAFFFDKSSEFDSVAEALATAMARSRTP